MPKGPKGEKRPADVIGAAVKVMKIATGEIADDIEPEQLASAAAETVPGFSFAPIRAYHKRAVFNDRTTLLPRRGAPFRRGFSLPNSSQAMFGNRPTLGEHGWGQNSWPNRP